MAEQEAFALIPVAPQLPGRELFHCSQALALDVMLKHSL